MKFDTLYARTSTGAVQQWTITVEDNYYTTTYGQKDGQLVTTDPSYCEGKNIGKKNETSPQAQAIKEAKAIYVKKRKEGYKENIEDIDIEDFFQPMLAKKFVDYADKVVYPLVVEDKLNGVRCVISSKGAFSRTGEEFHCVDHIKNQLYPLFVKYPDLQLDGELFNYALRNNLGEITSLVSVVRKASDVTDEDRRKAREIIQYHIYDGINFENARYNLSVTMATPLEERKIGLSLILTDFLVEELEPTKQRPYTFFHPYNYVDGYDEIGILMKQVKEEKREGLVLKNPNGPYESKRSKHMLKLKIFMDAEFEVVDFLEGTGNWAGKVKKVVCKLNVPATNGKTTFESNIRGTMEQLAELWINRAQHIGKKVTVDFQEYSPYGIPLIPYCDPFFRDYE